MKHVSFIEGFTESLMEKDYLNPIEKQAERNLHKKTAVVAMSFEQQCKKARRQQRKLDKHRAKIGSPNIKAVMGCGVSMHTGEYMKGDVIVKDGKAIQKWVLR